MRTSMRSTSSSGTISDPGGFDRSAGRGNQGYLPRYRPIAIRTRTKGCWRGRLPTRITSHFAGSQYNLQSGTAAHGQTYSTADCPAGLRSRSLRRSTIIANGSVTTPALATHHGTEFGFHDRSTIRSPGTSPASGIFAKWFKNYILPYGGCSSGAATPGCPPSQGTRELSPTFSNGPAHAYGAEAAVPSAFLLPAGSVWSGFGYFGQCYPMSIPRRRSTQA